MGALGYIAGGLMQGLGEGVAKQGILDAQQRHETLMESLRARRQQESNVQQADLNDRNAARDDERGLTLGLKKAEAEHGYKVKEEGQKLGNEITLTKLRSSLDTSKSEAEIRLRDQLDSGEVQSTFEGDDGLLYTVRKDGSTSATGVKYRPKKTGSDDDWLTGGDDAGPTPAKPAAAPAPKAQTYSQTEYQSGLARYSMTQQGKPAAQIKADWDALLRAKGYKLGAN
jgi:hypothetical protein